MNEGMTEAEKEARYYMNFALTNLAQGQQQQLANISIWEVVKYLHENPADKWPFNFASQIQKEFGCSINGHVWKAYSTVYFAD